MDLSKSEDTKYWNKIMKFFAKHKCGNVHKIAETLDIHWLTAQKELKKLEDVGMIHKEGKVYFLNKRDNLQKRVALSNKHTLFIDTLKPLFGDNFVRIKETKKENGKWRTVGSVSIPKNKIKEVGEFLRTVESNLDSLQ